MCYSQIWHNIRCDEYLCKLGKEYLNASLCIFVVNFLQHSEAFDVLHNFLPLTIADLSMLKQVHFFGPHCTWSFWGLCEFVGCCKVWFLWQMISIDRLWFFYLYMSVLSLCLFVFIVNKCVHKLDTVHLIHVFISLSF